MEYKLSEEVAREQLDVLYDYYEIVFNELPADLKPALEGADRKLLKAVRVGRLEVGVDGEGVIVVTQNLRGGEQLVYREIDGKAKVAMGGCDANDNYGKAYALMGSLCGLGETAIIKLKSHDLSIVECLGTVFLQA